MSTQLDRIHRAKVEELLGERGKTEARAIRFRDLAALAASIQSAVQSGQPKPVVSGTIPVPDFTPSATGTGTDSDENEAWALVGKTLFMRATDIDLSAWSGLGGAFMATADMVGSVTSDDAPDAYWGWTAEILPLAKWSGDQSLRVRFQFWSRFVTGVTGCSINWNIYRVSA